MSGCWNRLQCTHSGCTTGIGGAKLGPQFCGIRDGPRTHGVFFGVESALIHVFFSRDFTFAMEYRCVL